MTIIIVIKFSIRLCLFFYNKNTIVHYTMGLSIMACYSVVLK